MQNKGKERRGKITEKLKNERVLTLPPLNPTGSRRPCPVPQVKSFATYFAIFLNLFHLKIIKLMLGDFRKMYQTFIYVFANHVGTRGLREVGG